MCALTPQHTHSWLTRTTCVCFFPFSVCLCCLLIPPCVLVIFRRRRPEESTCARVFRLRIHNCDFLLIYSCRQLFPPSSSIYLFLSFSPVLLIQPCSFYSDSEFHSVSPLLLFPHHLSISIKQIKESKLISKNNSVSFFLATVPCTSKYSVIHDNHTWRTVKMSIGSTHRGVTMKV